MSTGYQVYNQGQVWHWRAIIMLTIVQIENLATRRRRLEPTPNRDTWKNMDDGAYVLPTIEVVPQRENSAIGAKSYSLSDSRTVSELKEFGEIVAPDAFELNLNYEGSVASKEHLENAKGHIGGSYIFTRHGGGHGVDAYFGGGASSLSGSSFTLSGNAYWSKKYQGSLQFEDYSGRQNNYSFTIPIRPPFALSINLNIGEKYWGLGGGISVGSNYGISTSVTETPVSWMKKF